MYGLASKFTGYHVQGVMVGQGLVGAGVPLAQIVTQILSPPKGGRFAGLGDHSHGPGGSHRRKTEGLEYSTFLFFTVALCFTIFSVLAQALLIRLPIYEYYTEDQPRQPIEFLAPPPSPPPISAERRGAAGRRAAAAAATAADGRKVSTSNDGRRNSVASQTSNRTTDTVTPAILEEEDRRHAEEEAVQEGVRRANRFRSSSLGAIVLANDASATRLMQDIYPKRRTHPLMILYISITLIYALTLSLFPSLTGLVESTNMDEYRSRLSGDLFVPFHFLVFNVGDWVGRSLPSIPWFTPDTSHPSRRQQLRYLFSSVARLVFIPIFLTANLPVSPEKRILPLLIQRDEVWFSLMFLFSVTNGYLSSIIMMVGPSFILGGEKRAQAGVRLGFWINTGLAIGSVVSFRVRKLMCVRGGCSTCDELKEGNRHEK
ncbi:hypothetical protein BGZ65_001391 [Modicella reniformis]|uniref:Equilibrative nucleoside transporter 1 n=1 Tax=Modicella reniformis TaxID=1440133 RepID=A0A9P6J203_9FUNG|nr:hypothetical protein BGZ65_001391 [Modicella reniformis]